MSTTTEEIVQVVTLGKCRCGAEGLLRDLPPAAIPGGAVRCPGCSSFSAFKIVVEERVTRRLIKDA